MRFLPALTALLLVWGCSGADTAKVAPAPPASLETEYNEAKAKASESTQSKAAYVAATVAYATQVMTGNGAPREKYPKALALYEEALKADPNNKEAKQNREMILSIYESLGKKPPKN